MKTPVKCLVVDDVEENLVAISALLGQDQVEVLQARSGTEALELLLVHDVALALLDVQMPEMDGFQLAELMRGSERTRHIPLIFVTAGGRDTQRLFKGYDSGAVDFLYKPVEPRILKNKADVFFQLHRQRQQLREELERRSEALRLNELFIAMLGHDLRNPLHVINLSAEALQGFSTDPSVRKIADRIQSSGRRMHRMIEDLLDLVRVRLADGIHLRREPTQLRPLVERVVQEHRTASPTRVITIIEDGDLNGHWDAGRLEQAVSNLVGNALQHGEGSGPVTLRLEGSDAEWVTLSVANAGSIPADVLPIIFDPFSSRKKRTDRSGGLGLGLYIVDQIVQAHQGRIDVRCDESGHTHFRVRLSRR
ncbi:MAG: hybrid sensor histidine kinase/response regulator [Panacagrimonas sp.]